jgi:hypothetical protein
VADAGTSRYLGRYPVTLDGSRSLDPDYSGQLSYLWTQLSGPPLILSSNTAEKPTISVPTTHPDQVQSAQFQLIVNDGESDSAPTRVTVYVLPVPDFSTRLSSYAPFDVNKPTIVYFDGGNCWSGGGDWNPEGWGNLVNWLSFGAYAPDPTPEQWYDLCADVLIGYLSSVAPDYEQSIQTAGFSTGGMPAIGVGIRLNRFYADPRFNVNRVSLLDGGCIMYDSYLREFVENPVGGEATWVENMFGSDCCYYWRPYSINILIPGGHAGPVNFFGRCVRTGWFSQTPYNNGLTGALFTSVAMQGARYRPPAVENLPYYFRWVWEAENVTGHFEYIDRLHFPGALPEPVNLTGPLNGDVVGLTGAALGCTNSLHARAYELLWGEQGQALQVVYAGETPVSLSTGPLPPGKTYSWTVRVTDGYGTTWQDDPRWFATPAGLAGDFNGDGVLDEADCAVARDSAKRTWGEAGFALAADLDGNGRVDCTDLDAWLGLYRLYTGDPNAADPCGLLDPDDQDNDTVRDLCDNCPAIENAAQADSDVDGLGDDCDNCAFVANRGQANLDGDEMGDACDDDVDGDAITNSQDNCPRLANTNQADSDQDGVGDLCDNCQAVINADQDNREGDPWGDACDVNSFCFDSDNDGFGDPGHPENTCAVDNCPTAGNPDQSDIDADTLGDVCDPDMDNDAVLNEVDNCPRHANHDQPDGDADGVGDACDACGNIPGAVVGSDGCSIVPGDLDRDGDVDQEDFGLFQLCLNGDYAVGPACAGASLNGDGFVDGQDMTLFQRCISGPNVPGAPGCNH